MNMMMVLSVDLGGAFSPERLAYGGKMTLLGMLMIFAVLGLLWGVLALFKVIFVPKTQKSTKQSEPKVVEPVKAEPVKQESISAPAEDLTLIAVLTAAVAAYREAEHENGTFRVVSFRKASDARAWNTKK